MKSACARYVSYKLNLRERSRGSGWLGPVVSWVMSSLYDLRSLCLLESEVGCHSVRIIHMSSVAPVGATEVSVWLLVSCCSTIIGMHDGHHHARS